MYTLIVRSLPAPVEAAKSATPQQTLIMGSMVAEWELVWQLGRHSHADAIVVLAPQVDRALIDTVAQLPNPERVRAVPYDRLDELTALRDVVVFSTGAMIAEAAYIRAAYGDQRWVVSGVTHALSSYIAVRQCLLLHVMGMQPHDSLICTSTAGRVAVRKLFEAVGRQLAGPHRACGECPIQLPLIPLPAPRFEWPLIPNAPAREAAALPAESVVFLSFGRFSEHMKADLGPLLIAFAELSTRVPQAMLVLAGDDRQGQSAQVGELARALGIADRVRIRPDPTAAQKALLYSAADVFISLSDSIQETFGLVLLEAMSAGLPVIASNWSGYRDLVRDGQTGILIPTYWSDCLSSLGAMAPLSGDREPNWAAAQALVVDVPATVAAMERLALDPLLRRRMGECGAAVARKDFSGEAIVQRYEELWDESRRAFRPAVDGRHRTGDLMACDYYRSFAGYASHHVADDTVFSISPRGVRVLTGDLKIPGFERDRAGYQRSRLLDVLGLMHQRRQGTVADVLGADRHERDLRHLLRLAKYGLVDISPSEVDTA